MKNEAEFCTIIKNSLISGYKIPDPGFGNFASSSIRCFDGIGMIQENGRYEFVCWEAKFLKTMQSFSLSRIEPHQAFYLNAYIQADIRAFIFLGVNVSRGDKRAYIFDWQGIWKLYNERFSIYKKYLEKLPYNKISKGKFLMENIISYDILSNVYEGNLSLEISLQKQRIKEEEKR